MKRQIITIMLALVAAAGQGQKVVLHMAGNKTFECTVSQLDSIIFEDDGFIIVDEHEWVDLGLPSGTLWATCNVGANSPEEYGDYFAWGETEPKKKHRWYTYKWCRHSKNRITKYCINSKSGKVDNKTELLPEDDAATTNWGSEWQMPSYDQIKELYNSEYTTSEWTTQNGVNGMLITSKSNSDTIFLPAAGEHYGKSLERAGTEGDYWSRSLDASYGGSGYDLYFNFCSIDWNNGRRCYGRSVRPVRVKTR